MLYVVRVLGPIVGRTQTPVSMSRVWVSSQITPSGHLSPHAILSGPNLFHHKGWGSKCVLLTLNSILKIFSFLLITPLIFHLWTQNFPGISKISSNSWRKLSLKSEGQNCFNSPVWLRCLVTSKTEMVSLPGQLSHYDNSLICDVNSPAILHSDYISIIMSGMRVGPLGSFITQMENWWSCAKS